MKESLIFVVLVGCGFAIIAESFNYHNEKKKPIEQKQPAPSSNVKKRVVITAESSSQLTPVVNEGRAIVNRNPVTGV